MGEVGGRGGSRRSTRRAATGAYATLRRRRAWSARSPKVSSPSATPSPSWPRHGRARPGEARQRQQRPKNWAGFAAALRARAGRARARAPDRCRSARSRRRAVAPRNRAVPAGRLGRSETSAISSKRSPAGQSLVNRLAVWIVGLVWGNSVPSRGRPQRSGREGQLGRQPRALSSFVSASEVIRQCARPLSARRDEESSSRSAWRRDVTNYRQLAQRSWSGPRSTRVTDPSRRASRKPWASRSPRSIGRPIPITGAHARLPDPVIEEGRG